MVKELIADTLDAVAQLFNQAGSEAFCTNDLNLVWSGGSIVRRLRYIARIERGIHGKLLDVILGKPLVLENPHAIFIRIAIRTSLFSVANRITPPPSYA